LNFFELAVSALGNAPLAERQLCHSAAPTRQVRKRYACSAGRVKQFSATVAVPRSGTKAPALTASEAIPARGAPAGIAVPLRFSQ